MTVSRVARAVLVGCVLLAGCTSGDDGAVDGDGTADGDPGEAAAPPAAEDEPSEPAGRLQLTGFEEHQAGGLSLALLSVEIADGGHILVEIEAVNSGTGTRRLSGLSTIVVDDLDNRYRFVPPPDDTSLTLRSDQRMTGTLSFEGPIDRDAQRLTVAFNQRRDTPTPELVSAQDRQANDQYAPMAFRDVPLPGVGLEDEATSDAGGSLLDPVIVDVGDVGTPDAAPDVEVTVVRYTTDGRTLELEIEVVNGSSQRVRMMAERPVLTDDLGSRFQYRRAEGDRTEQLLELEPGEEASATLGFRATLRPEASELRLTLNGFGMRNDSERTPGLVFTLPVPDLDGQDGS